MVSLKRVVAILIAVLAPLAILVVISATDSRAITLRREKANDLRRISHQLQRQSINEVLRDLGPPGSISFQAALHPQRAGGPQRAAYLTLRYEYEFRAMPWSHPYTVYLQAEIEMPTGRVADIRVEETYGV